MVESFYLSDKHLTEGQIKDLAYQGTMIKQVSPGFGGLAARKLAEMGFEFDMGTNTWRELPRALTEEEHLQHSAVLTLQNLGYVWNGGELWKPPLGTMPKHLAAPPCPSAPESPVKKKHSHYYRPCPFKTVDVYRVLRLFNITNNEIGHAIKKLLCSGIRGGNKDHDKDVSEAIDTLQRHLEMNQEERDCHAG